MTDSMNVFDRRAVRMHRDRAAANFANYDFLLHEVAERLLDRLDDLTYQFPLALDLGCHTGELGKSIKGRGGVETLIQCDVSIPMVERASGLRVVADEEFLPFGGGKFDLVMSCLSLHWVNDLPGAFLQIRQALKEDGLFLGAMLGGDSLFELRNSFARAEMDQEGGVSPRFSPLARVQDIGNLLQRAGFALPVVDTDVITVSYGDPFKLLKDLRGMGESNAVHQRRKNFSRRNTLMAAVERYMTDHSGPDGRVPATFDVLFIAAWTPAPNQQKPMVRGTGEINLGNFLNSDDT